MHDVRAAICGLILSVSAGAALAQQAGSPPPLPMTLTSTSFVDGGVLPDKNTAASAKPVSPELSWENAPAATVSFTLIFHDLDAATDKTSEDHLHWGISIFRPMSIRWPRGNPMCRNFLMVAFK